MSMVAWILAGLAMVVLLIAALGVLRLPDALSRQHAATKAATLAVSLLLLAMIIMALTAGWQGAWVWRLLAILLFLLITLPLASHALAMASLAEKPPQSK